MYLSEPTMCAYYVTDHTTTAKQDLECMESYICIILLCHETIQTSALGHHFTHTH